MQKNKNRNPLIAVVLILFICFLSGAEIFLTSPKEPADSVIVSAEPTPTITPTVSPSPTPFPTKEPDVLPVFETPGDPYPDMYGDNPKQQFAPPEEAMVYLTFDDGPSSSTPALLEVLKEEGVPATFFIASNRHPDLIKQIYDDGHALGVHTYTHEYDYVYWHKEAYLADFARCYLTILDATGYRPRIFRFPGGSVNSYNKHLVRELVTEMEGRGFVYYDWNVTSEDASTATTYEEQLENLITQSANKKRIIALMHDTKKNDQIAQVVRDYIRYMKENGYRFASLDSSVEPIRFPMP